MAKVLPGSSRESFTFIMSHWRGLLNVSILPLVLIAILTWLQLGGMGPMFEAYIAEFSKPNAPLDAALSAELTLALPRYYALGLLILIITAWKYVRIVQFWRRGQGEILAIAPGEVQATARTIFYGIGMLALTALLYVALTIVAMIIGYVALKGLSASAGQAVAMIIGIAEILLLGVFLYRFLVGLPGVALGERPNLFHDIWPLARDENWGLPMRQLFWFVVGLIPVFIVSGVFYVPLLQDVIAQIEGNATARLSTDLMARIVTSMGTMQFINLILQIPVMWFGIILSGVAHFRFRAKLVQVLAK